MKLKPLKLKFNAFDRVVSDLNPHSEHQWFLIGQKMDQYATGRSRKYFSICAYHKKGRRTGSKMIGEV